MNLSLINLCCICSNTRASAEMLKPESESTKKGGLVEIELHFSFMVLGSKFSFFIHLALIETSIISFMSFSCMYIDEFRTGFWWIFAAMEGLENMAFVSNAISLVTYFNGYMNFSLTKSATSLTNFMGTSFLLTLFGGFISDTFISRFKTCVLFGCIELLVCSCLAFSKSQAHSCTDTAPSVLITACGLVLFLKPC